ncbi:MAG TPA: hypothetical protein VIP11_24015 [Gemmatimonadaceae bacterium]
MSLRTFLDSAGNEWQAFDVIPRADERRSYDRRNSDESDGEVQDRRDSDRRLTVGGAGGMTGSEGWLVFERANERRRLSPIPANWTRLSDAQLEACRRAARLVRPSTIATEQVADGDR